MADALISIDRSLAVAGSESILQFAKPSVDGLHANSCPRAAASASSASGMIASSMLTPQSVPIPR
jgi:hypothetical protein